MSELADPHKELAVEWIIIIPYISGAGSTQRDEGLSVIILAKDFNRWWRSKGWRILINWDK